MPEGVLGDELLEAQLQRAVMAASIGAADRDECIAVAGRIGGVDLDRWYEEWRRVGDLAVADAERLIGLDDHGGASRAFLRASTYYRTAGVMLYGTPVDPRLIAANADQTDAFRRACALFPNPPSVVEVPYEGTTLPGYWFEPAPAEESTLDGAVVVLTGGYDGTAEELYTFTGAAAAARGYRVLCFDGPGQGAALLQQGLTVRPDWEAVIAPAIDWITARPGVDPARIALVGLSLGAHLAPAAASREHRVAACAADCGSFDLYASAIERLPGPLVAGLDPRNRVRRWLLSKVLGIVAAKPTAGWALRRGQLVHGASSPLGYLESLRPFTLRDKAAAIRCPVFVNNAEDDDIGATAPELAAALTVPHVFTTFTRAQGAGDHCEVGNRQVYLDALFAWMDPLLTSGA